MAGLRARHPRGIASDGERIVAIRGLEVLDSRGWPTVEAEVRLAGGAVAHASVPAGMSTGRHEARERRDGDAARYAGRGVKGALRAVHAVIAPALTGLDAADQAVVDARLVELDGTQDRSRLGANAILAVSVAVARAASFAAGIPLWRHLVGDRKPLLPLPMVNMISGGLHAPGGLMVQDFLVVPLGARSVAGALASCAAVRAALGDELAARGLSTLKADEGGFAPALASNDAALDLLMTAVARAGLVPGVDIGVALDIAATHLLDPTDGRYRLTAGGPPCDANDVVAAIEDLVDRYPIVSVEDPVAEDDWDGWRLATERLGHRSQLVGDDVFVTNPLRLERGVRLGVANALLVKMNQVGTLTEAVSAAEQAHAAGYASIVSARSGETEDDALADLAVAVGGGQIKVGSLAQSDRLAKYNRLLRIEGATDAPPFAGAATLACR